MFITYLKLLLNSLTSISKGYFNQEWPDSLCDLSASPECTRWQSCPPVRAREGVDIGTIPKVCAGLKDDVSCPMRKHLLSAWSVGEQWVSITQTGSQERDIIPTAPLFVKSECSCKLLDVLQISPFLYWKSSVSVKKLFKIGWYIFSCYLSNCE